MLENLLPQICLTAAVCYGTIGMVMEQSEFSLAGVMGNWNVLVTA